MMMDTMVVKRFLVGANYFLAHPRLFLLPTVLALRSFTLDVFVA
jgi:hypothetical protein